MAAPGAQVPGFLDMSAHLPELPSTYYHRNFQQLIDQSQYLYVDLLDQQQQQWLHRYQTLPGSAQCLYVRLLSRKGEWFRSEKLHYAEIPDIQNAAQALHQARLIDIFSADKLSDQHSDALACFTKAELGSCLQLKGWRSLTREQLLLHVRETLPNAWSTLLSAELYRVNSQDFLELLQLLFFGDLQHSLTDFVLSDLGIYRYESYSLASEQRFFTTTAQLHEHWQFERWRLQLPELKALASADLIRLLQQLPEPIDAVMTRRVERLRLAMARQLERLGELDLALDYYQMCQQPPARERRLRILHKRADQQRIPLATEILQGPRSEEERQFIQRFAARMKVPELTPWLVAEQVVEQQCWQVDEQGRQVWQQHGVEQAALYSWQQRHSGEGFYVENTLLCSVFALTFWPVLYAPLAGAFFHPFQPRPADLYEPDFLAKRQQIWRQCQYDWQQADWLQQLQQRAEQKWGIANVFMHWPAMERWWQAGLPLALARIPKAHWQLMFDYLWQDLRRHRSGMPDLIVFPEQGGYQWLEVKGPGDTLQANQRAWFDYFGRYQMPAQVIQLRSS